MNGEDTAVLMRQIYERYDGDLVLDLPDVSEADLQAAIDRLREL